MKSPSVDTHDEPPFGWITADGVFVGLVAIAFPAAVASHFFYPGTNTFIRCCLARLTGEDFEVSANKLGAGLAVAPAVAP